MKTYSFITLQQHLPSLKKTFLASFILLLIISSSYAQDCGCTHVVEAEATNVDGTAMGFAPGDIICVKGGEYNGFFWKNIVGTAENPIIIKNCGGQVIIDAPGSYGWKWHSSKHFKILGNGDSSIEYGFKVTTAKSFFITMEYFTTNFEIAHVEVVGKDEEEDIYTGFAGIGLKTSPYQDCDLFQEQGAWTLEDVSIHDNYIHKVGGEGIYAGHGFHQGREESRCPDGVKTYPHAIHNLHVYNNRIEDIGFDGIQIKNATQNTSVHDNIIYNYGVREEGPHNEGLFIGESTEGVFYNNRIEKGTGHGMQLNGYGNSKFYNNLIIDSHDNGVYFNNRSRSFENKIGTFEFSHNTFVNMGEHAFEAYTSDSIPTTIILKNNLFINYAQDQHRGTSLIVEGDIYTDDVNSIGFTNPELNDYTLAANSIARNAGVPLPDISFDVVNNPRDDGQNDVGAYEYIFLSRLELSMIPNSDIQVEPNSNVTIAVTLIDDLSLVEKVQYVLNGEIIGTDVLPSTTEHLISSASLNPGGNDFYAIAVKFDGSSIQTTSINIEVTYPNPEISLITPSSDILIETGNSVKVEAALVDEFDQVERVQYVLNGKTIGTDVLPKATEHTIGAAKLNIGYNDFHAIAVTFDGTIAQTSTINILVTYPTPEIYLVAPLSDIQIEAGNSVKVEAALVDQFDQVEKVQYILNGQIIGTDVLPKAIEHTIGASKLNVGDNEFHAIAVTIYGVTVQTPSITIEVLSSASRTSSNTLLDKSTELDHNSQIIVYPNPAITYIQVKLQQDQVQHYELTTITGQIIKSGQLSNDHLIGLNGMKSGIYLLRLKSAKGYAIKKIIKE